MDLHETKKIIESEIEAGDLTREVRSQIKTYIDQKQNLRKGFKETFKPLIESQEAVKVSIDKEQNAMIEQLQKNQKALTEGLDKNRHAITQAFDKMDEVKRWDLNQLPGFEAIEEPEKEIEKEPLEAQKSPSSLDESTLYMITHRVLNKPIGEEIYPNDDEKEIVTFKDISNIYSKSPIDKSRYNIRFSQRTREVLLDDKKPITTVEYSKDEMNKHLINKKIVELLNNFGLKLPSEYRNKSMEEFQEAFVKGMEVAANLKRKIKNVAKYEQDTDTGILRAYADKGDSAHPTSKKKY